MRKQRNVLPRFLAALVFFALIFTAGNLAYAQESIYGHISFVDKEATVIREDQTEHKAVVNLPVVPGDQVVTGQAGRCELQFDNGTVIRLDKNSRLKVTTVLAPSLTSRWKITTLHLLEGQIYSVNQNYNREMFQVITPNAAFDLKKRSKVTFKLLDDGSTFVYIDRGKIKVLFGENADKIETAAIGSGKGYTVTSSHQVHAGDDKRDIEFVGWNSYVNRNFNELHRGISKVPKKITRYNKALVYWAEKWSSLFGEWVYDDLFGYVWKPYDEIFAYSHRPFFHADFVKINNQLFIVPQQPWGWVPAHMGTWTWTSGGWTWIPGEAFHSGLTGFQTFSFPTFTYWITHIYGGYDLYYTYRIHGASAWRTAYRDVYKESKKNPTIKDVPESIRNIVKKMNDIPVKAIKERLGSKRPDPRIDMRKVKSIISPAKTLRPKTTTSPGKAVNSKLKTSASIAVSSQPAIHPSSSLEPRLPGEKLKRGGGARNFRDWNPDNQWALSHGYTLRYSSKTNEVVCPDLKISSQSLSKHDRENLIRRASTTRKRGYVSGSSSSSSSSSGSSGGTVTKTSTVKSSSVSRNSSARGGNNKEK
jgi:hypothetical protein